MSILFEGGKFLCKIEGDPSPVPNLCYFCATCGEIWARAFNGASFWVISPRACAAHGDGSLLPLHTLLYRTSGIIEKFPRVLLERELLQANPSPPDNWRIL